MKKLVLLTIALLLFVFYNYGLYRWVASSHSFPDVFSAIHSDWLLTITVVDMGVLSLLCVVWLLVDMQKRRWPAGKRAGVILATFIIGAVPFLLYLAFRNDGKARPLSPKSNLE